MNCQTFEMEFEQENLTGARLKESQELIQALNLEQQKGFVGLGDTPKKDWPFRALTTEELFVFAVLCPTHQAVAGFDRFLIPLEALWVIAQIKKVKGTIDDLEVWATENEVSPHYVLVYRETQRLYLLARWGQQIPLIGELKEKALRQYRQELTKKLEAIKESVDFNLGRIEILTQQALSSGRSEFPFYSF